MKTLILMVLMVGSLGAIAAETSTDNCAAIEQGAGGVRAVDGSGATRTDTADQIQ